MHEPLSGPAPRRALTLAVALVLSSGAAFSLAAPGVASASSATLYVAQGIQIGNDTSCSDPGYNTVQAAVNAASPGDTVYLCGTTPYHEQVIDTTSVTLTGAPGASIVAPSPWVASSDPLPPQFSSDSLIAPEALLVIWGAGVDTVVNGLTISGPLPNNGGCAEPEYGILVIGGATADIAGDTVTNIADSNPANYGCQAGIGIQIGREYWPNNNGQFQAEDFVGTATISGTSVSGYQKGGIVVDGPGSSASIEHNTVTGAGPLSPFGDIIAQNGVQVSRGASGSVSHNTISDNQYSGTGETSATGVLVYGGGGDPLTTNVSVVGNTLVNNDIGVALDNYNASFTAPPSTKTQDNAVNNTISNDEVTNTTGYGSGNDGAAICGYQAGVSDFGNHDNIKNNTVTGAGYGPATCSSSQSVPAFLFTVDTTGSTNPRVANNK